MSTELDLAMLLLRVALGVMLIAHGANKILGTGGMDATAGWFESLGLRPGHLHARLASFTEIGAGALILVGLATTVASAAFIGLMLVATFTDHRGKGYFVFNGGWEYTVLVAAVAVVPAWWARAAGRSITCTAWTPSVSVGRAPPSPPVCSQPPA